MSRRTLRALLPILASVAVLAGVTGAGAQTTSPAPVTTGTPEQKAAAITGPAVVYIEQSWKAWVRVPRSSELIYFEGYVNDGYAFEWGTRCSGFVVNPTGYIFTAGHCVDKGEEGARGTALELAVQWLVDQGYIYKRDFQYWLDEAHLLWGVEGEEKGSEPDLEIYVQHGIAAGGLTTGEAFPARLVDYSPWSEGDGALLKVEESDLPTLLVAPSTSIAIGLPILAVGYPGSTDAVTDASLEPTFKDGQVNAEKTREGGLLPVYEISAALSGGMSGGPTVDMNGDLVGVNSFGIVGETEAFNFITPGSIVTEMMAQNGVTNELGPIDIAYRAGVDAYFQGDYQTAIAKFEEVLALSPTHQQAQELKVEATKASTSAPSTPPPTGGPQDPGEDATADEGGFPVVAVVGIVAAVLVIGGIFFVMSRRKGPGAPAPAQAPPLQAVGATPPQPDAEAARSVGFQPTPAATPPQATAPPPAAPPAPPPTPPPGGHVEARFCPNCGHQLEADAHFCPSCGHKIEG
jgi:S1-C subfamily serine protease